MKDKFIQFLRDNNIRDRFYFLFNPQFNRRGWDLETYLLKEDPERYIGNAFIWADSREGDDFWRNLDSEWEYALAHRRVKITVEDL